MEITISKARLTLPDTLNNARRGEGGGEKALGIPSLEHLQFV